MQGLDARACRGDRAGTFCKEGVAGGADVHMYRRLQGYGHMGPGMHQLDSKHDLGNEIDPLTGQLIQDPGLASSMGLPSNSAAGGIIMKKGACPSCCLPLMPCQQQHRKAVAYSADGSVYSEITCARMLASREFAALCGSMEDACLSARLSQISVITETKLS